MKSVLAYLLAVFLSTTVDTAAPTANSTCTQTPYGSGCTTNADCTNCPSAPLKTGCGTSNEAKSICFCAAPGGNCDKGGIPCCDGSDCPAASKAGDNSRCPEAVLNGICRMQRITGIFKPRLVCPIGSSCIRNSALRAASIDLSNQFGICTATSDVSVPTVAEATSPAPKTDSRCTTTPYNTHCTTNADCKTCPSARIPFKTGCGKMSGIQLGGPTCLCATPTNYCGNNRPCCDGSYCPATSQTGERGRCPAAVLNGFCRMRTFRTEPPTVCPSGSSCISNSTLDAAIGKWSSDFGICTATAAVSVPTTAETITAAPTADPTCTPTPESAACKTDADCKICPSAKYKFKTVCRPYDPQIDGRICLLACAAPGAECSSDSQCCDGSDCPAPSKPGELSSCPAAVLNGICQLEKVRYGPVCPTGSECIRKGGSVDLLSTFGICTAVSTVAGSTATSSTDAASTATSSTDASSTATPSTDADSTATSSTDAGSTATSSTDASSTATDITDAGSTASGGTAAGITVASVRAASVVTPAPYGK